MLRQGLMGSQQAGRYGHGEEAVGSRPGPPDAARQAQLGHDGSHQRILIDGQGQIVIGPCSLTRRDV